MEASAGEASPLGEDLSTLKRRDKGKQKLIDSEDDEDSGNSTDEEIMKCNKGKVVGNEKEGVEEEEEEVEKKEEDEGEEEEREEDKTVFGHLMKVLRTAANAGGVGGVTTPLSGWNDLVNIISTSDILTPHVAITWQGEGIRIDFSSFGVATVTDNVDQLFGAFASTLLPIAELDFSRIPLSAVDITFIYEATQAKFSDKNPVMRFNLSEASAGLNEAQLDTAFGCIVSATPVQLSWELELVDPSRDDGDGHSYRRDDAEPGDYLRAADALTSGSKPDAAEKPLRQISPLELYLREVKKRNRELRKLESGEGGTLDLRNFYMQPWSNPLRNTLRFPALLSYWYATTIDLSSNELKEIPDHLRYCVHIRKLFANDNRLKKLPDFLSEARELKVIGLRNNRFTRFPRCLERLATLKRVDLRNNKVSKVRWEAIRCLRVLLVIDLRDNPAMTAKVAKAIDSVVGDNQPDAIELRISEEQTFWIAKKIQHVGSSRAITSLAPKRFKKSSSIIRNSPLPYDLATIVTRDKVLYLSRRKIYVHHLAQLVSVILNIQSFNERNPSRAVPITLEELDLSYNYIRNDGMDYIASLLAKNKTITRLDLRRNGITCKGLHRVLPVLNHNVFLVDLRFEEVKWLPLGRTEKEEVKVLANSKRYFLDAQPPSLLDWKKLDEKLKYLMHNNSKFLMAIAGHVDVLDLQRRSQLYFNVHLLTKLHHLRVIDMSYNSLRQIPIEIGQVTKLEQLILAHNTLLDIPSQIGQLVNLKVLNLTDNKLAFLDPAVGQLTMLRQLLLAQNELIDLPWPELCQLRGLELLDVSENKMPGMSLDRARMKKRASGDDVTLSAFARLRYNGDEWLLVKDPL